MSELIVVVSSARAGSTNLRRVLQAFHQVETFGEAFNPTGGMDQDRIRKVAPFMGVDASDIDAARAKLLEAARRDPVAACARFLAYADAAGGGFAEIKALPGHLSAPVFARILRTFRPVGVFLYRSPIDVFISLEKAKALGRFRRVDTTDVRPSIAAKDFLAWKWKQQNHYQMATYFFRKMNLRMLSISYEEMYADPRSPLAYIQARFGEISVDLGAYDEEKASFMTRQDRTSDRAHKVANWDQFYHDVRKYVSDEDLDRYEFDGNRYSLWAQNRIETVMSEKLKRQLAAMALPLLSIPRYVLGARRNRT